MSNPNTWANVLVVNAFGSKIFNVELKHRYDTDHYDQGSWGVIENGAQSSSFKVGYWTGFGRTGKDYWKIQFEAGGQVWSCKTNFYCFLTGDDANKTVKIRVYKDGSSGKMEVQCPGSSNCTVSLNVATATPNTWASAAVKNDFGTRIYNVEVKHRYDDDHFDQDRWSTIGNGEQGSDFKVGYWTGFGRTGKDYWSVQFEAYGKIWNCKSNFYCFLTGDDADKLVPLRVYRDGDDAKMELQCPGSSHCTVSLNGTENSRPDLSGWMGQNQAALQGRKIGEIALPGSHDAGMYEVRACTLGKIGGPTACNTQTQARTIAGQLACGIRYFDLRPVYKKDSFDTGHFGDTSLGIMGCLGGSLDTVLQDVADFAAAQPNDLVILKFSHYLNREKSSFGFSNEIKAQLTNKVTAALGSHLLKDQSGVDLFALTLGEILQMGSIIALFEDIPTDWPRGILGLEKLPIYDKYSETNDFVKMKTDQFQKLKDHGGASNKLFLLSWTLTQGKTQAAACNLDPTGLTSSIEDLAKEANGNLQQVLDNQNAGGKRLNILYTDYCDTFPTRICLQANGLI